MINIEADFGQFISEQKRKHSLLSTELARQLEISSAYLSQLEHGKRVCPDTELLRKMVLKFDLSREETAVFYDLYERASGKLCPDIAEYIMSNDTVRKALRYASNIGATDEDWEQFINSLDKSKQQ